MRVSPCVAPALKCVADPYALPLALPSPCAVGFGVGWVGGQSKGVCKGSIASQSTPPPRRQKNSRHTEEEEKEG